MNNRQKVVEALNKNRKVKLVKIESPNLKHILTIKLAKKGSEHLYGYLGLYRNEDNKECYCVNFNNKAPSNAVIVGAEYNPEVLVNTLDRLDFCNLCDAIDCYNDTRWSVGDIQPYSFIVGFCLAKGLDLIRRGLVGIKG